MNLSNILLVAGREFRQVMQLKSFWLTLLLIPIALALGPLLGDKLKEQEPTRVIVVDRAGGQTAKMLEAAFLSQGDQRKLTALSRYVRRYKLESADPAAPWAQHDRLYTPADVAAFRADGGVEGALAKIARVKPEATPDFEPAPDDYIFAAPPAAMVAARGTDFADLAKDFVGKSKKAPAAERADIVLLVDKGYPEDPTVRLWANEQPRALFAATLQEALTADLRSQVLTRSGLSPQQAMQVQTAAPRLAISTPPPGGGAKEALLVRSIVPLALAYILMMGLMLSGSWMLQGAIEERSKKLLESVLACISPEDLMYGKLLGAIAIGLSMLFVWLGAGVFAAYMTEGTIADMIRPALAPVTSPFAIATMIYFFVAGYIAISILFVAIGALSDSMSEAQGYLMPIMLLILLPVTFLIQAILLGSGGPLVQVMTWVPVWTPFTVLARLGGGISTLEVLGAGAVLAIFVALEMVLLARLFRASLLAQGQKPGLKVILERLKPVKA